mgnify:CR=1 FL=1
MFQTVHYHLKSKKIKSAVTIVMLADLHNQLYGENNEILLGEIEKLSPDFVCLAGDMLIGHSKIPYEVGQTTVIELAKRYTVFYGLGNHESRMKHDVTIYGTKYEDYMEPIEKLGVKILVNDKAEFRVGDNRFCIYGYDLPEKYFEKFVYINLEFEEEIKNALTERDNLNKKHRSFLQKREDLSKHMAELDKEKP